jgi:hypothetical protein
LYVALTTLIRLKPHQPVRVLWPTWKRKIFNRATTKLEITKKVTQKSRALQVLHVAVLCMFSEQGSVPGFKTRLCRYK